MGWFFKTIAKQLNVNSSKPLLMKLIKVKIDLRDVAPITSRVEDLAIKIKPTHYKVFVSDKELVDELEPHYVFLVPNSPLRMTSELPKSKFSSGETSRPKVCL